MKAFACSKKITSAVLFVALSIMLTIIPSGAEAKTYTVAWDPNTESDVAGYDLFLGNPLAADPTKVDTAKPIAKVGTLSHTSCDMLNKQCKQTVDVTIQGADRKVMVAQAFDYAGNHSDYSLTAVTSTPDGKPSGEVFFFTDVTPPAPPKGIMELLERIASALESIAAKM